MARKSSDTIKLNLRFTEALRRKLERVAERNDQSINSEIVARLEASFHAEEIRETIRSEMSRFYGRTIKNPEGV